MCSFLSLQFKYVIFHIFISILHLLRVYYELTIWLAPRWLDSSVCRALHRYRLSCVYNCDDQSCVHFFLRSSNMWSFIYSFPKNLMYGPSGNQLQFNSANSNSVISNFPLFYLLLDISKSCYLEQFFVSPTSSKYRGSAVVLFSLESWCFPRLRLGKLQDSRENKTNCSLGTIH